MATIEYWIQLENRPWDASPNNIDRITGEDMKERTTKDPVVEVTLKSPGTGVTTKRTMYNPLRKDDGVAVRDALILRRYRPPTLEDESDAWTVPDDRKVNPWDLNEPDPTDNGTMGTIPGAVIECNVGDEVKVHFRNLDKRATLESKTICTPFIGGRIIEGPIEIEDFCFPVLISVPFPVEQRTHSLHPHGFVFDARYDGAYPLSPPDPDQPVAGGGPGLGPDETALWATVPRFRGTLKKGDRVPPGGTFVYTWNTLSWPTTAGVWLYHDHSICDTDSVDLGAIGIIVIHNPADTEQEVDIRDPNDPTALDPDFLPEGSPNGDPRIWHFFRFPPTNFPGFPFREIRALPNDLDGLGAHDEIPHGHGMTAKAERVKPECEHDVTLPILERTIRRGDLLFQLDKELRLFEGFWLRFYRTPPSKALYLQLFHNLRGGSVMINGRTFLGNTPTMVAGPDTRMRFGVVGMGSDFHTFHIHGHRWIIPGPDGNTVAAIQASPQVTATSQFEDTKIFGPANSFAFTIDEASGFMRASPPIGEWHMHCHVLSHMMLGMMGSLLVVNGGDLAFPLPVGVPCEMPEMGGGTTPQGGGTTTTTTTTAPPTTIAVTNNVFTPDDVTVASGSQVTFDFVDGGHTVRPVSENMADPIPRINNGNGDSDAMPAGQQRTVTITGMPGGEINYECGIHFGFMTGKIGIE